MRAPAPSVRVRTETLDRLLSSVGEVILASTQLRSAAAAGASPPSAPALDARLDRMDRVVGELQRRALELRTAPVLRVVEMLPRLAHDLAQRRGKKVEVELSGAELELDRSILDRVADPLVHLVRNAVDHGIESPPERRAAGKPEAGRIQVAARREKDSIWIVVSDDGRGVDLEAVRERAVAAGLVLSDLAEDLPPSEIAALVFRPGLSTAQSVSEVSGRGVGMDAVRATVESLGGRVELETAPRRGTATTLVLPIDAAIQRVLLFGCAGEVVAVPIAKIERILELAGEEIERSGNEAFALVDDEPVPVLDLARQIGLPAPPPTPRVTLALAEVRGARLGLAVERLAGQQEIYVKPLPRLLAGVRALVGLTITGEGRPVFLLDLNQLA